MIKEFIGVGKTIDEASLSAKTGLNAPLSADVKIEVIQMPKKKVLGLFGGADAQVRAYYDDGKKEKKPRKNNKNNTKTQKPKQQKEQKSAKVQETSVPKAPQPKPQKEKPAAPAHSERKTFEPIDEKDLDLNAACDYVKTILNGFNVENAEVSAKYADGIVEMNIESDDYGIIIGRRGETLDAIQYLTSLVLKNGAEKYVRVSINIGDYKEKRAETLKNLAIKNANYVLRTGRRYTFEPMNPYERRIIHTSIQSVEGVISNSVGSGIDRRVVLEPVGGVKRNYSNYNRGSYNKNRRPQNTATTTPSRPPRADREGAPKFGKIEINKDI